MNRWPFYDSCQGRNNFSRCNLVFYSRVTGAYSCRLRTAFAGGCGCRGLRGRPFAVSAAGLIAVNRRSLAEKKPLADRQCFASPLPIAPVMLDNFDAGGICISFVAFIFAFEDMNAGRKSPDPGNIAIIVDKMTKRFARPGGWIGKKGWKTSCANATLPLLQTTS